jgi:hypothetical protein
MTPSAGSAGIPGLAPVLALRRRVRDGEERDRGDAEAGQPRGLGDEQVGREPFDAWHRFDGLATARALDHEQRLDEVVGRKRILAGEAPREGVAPHAPQARGWEPSCGLRSHQVPAAEFLR